MQNIPAMKIPSVKISAPNAGVSTSSKMPTFKMPKAPSSIKISQPKIPKSGNNSAIFNIGKFTKPMKIPKEAQMKVVKGAIKKVKNAGF